ncbi:glycine betaine/proline transport system permease protein [Rhodobium orientis]|uniref:Choline ABC transporter permease subunit n=1 Tax=Rhodobium orientis TaxID=34017 RepID=A0A327JPH2_9HYPH|nr:choline ABC transporter permease subunit [Rhodobium orientis]MBB4301953.1 glycine betaine/proline transport system permease protein [Rhodobium orientis]MBK5950190.1 choline ABC transporter permease subunit [Rhodobium orientis]RAI27254.1 choline ABC transporter permease subunit [Rhodobium orientis]
MDWLTETKIPLGKWVEAGVEAFNVWASGFLDAVSETLQTLIEGLTDGMAAVPPVVLVLVFAALAGYLKKSWKLALGVVLGLFLIINMGYWDETLETLALVVFATFVCMVIGVPIGIAAAHRPWLEAILRPVLDLMQTLPTFAYLIPTLILFGLGVVPGLISTVIFAIPAPIRLTTLGIKSTPNALVEAGKAFGCTKNQLLFKVELPSAMPTIMAGLTQCIMLSLSMVVIAALVGADGLGEPVLRALNTVNIAKGFESGLAIVIVAILLDRVFRRAEPPSEQR